MQPGVATGRLDLALDERFQRLRADLGIESFGLNLMHLAPGQRGRIHRHERQEEVYVVLEGTLTVDVAEDEPIVLERGGVARVAPEVRRQLVNRGAEPVAVLALGAAGEHQGRDGEAFASWEDDEPRAPQELPLPPDEPRA